MGAVQSLPQFTTQLEQLASLNVDTDAKRARLTKIICTIGPIATKEMIKDLLKAGMNIARLNFSHDSHVEHERRIKMIREAVAELENETKLMYPLAIALDTKGPEVRTGTLKRGIGNKIELKTGNKVKLTVSEGDKGECSDKQIYISYERLPQILDINRPGTIYIDDGKIILKPTKIEGNTVICEISQGGLLGSRKGVVLPGVDLGLPAVSEQDKLDLQFGVKHKVDMIFASFIQDASGVEAVREALNQTYPRILVVAKIETKSALNHIDEIIKVADGVMVARGDLAVHTPITRLFQAQKSIIAKCNIAGKPVICATQMLESMMNEVRPARSDVTDIANAVLDGADGVMLSGETAIGKHPVKCVETMDEICKHAEMSIWHRRMFEELTSKDLKQQKELTTYDNLLSQSSVYESMISGASAIIIDIHDLVHFAAKLRPHCPIITITYYQATSEEVSKKLLLVRGVHELRVKSGDDAASTDSVQLCLAYAKNTGIVKKDDNVVILSFNNGKKIEELSLKCWYIK